jgi:hypothetical protein
MKNIMIKPIPLVAFILLSLSCSSGGNEFGKLKIDVPKDSTFMDDVLEDGVHHYSLKWKEYGQNSVFMISKWPVDMSVSRIPSTVKAIIEKTFVKSKERGTLEEGTKIQYREISGKSLSGNLGYFEFADKNGKRRISTVHMVTDGDVIWNGYFSGAKELFEVSVDVLKTAEPNGEPG